MNKIAQLAVARPKAVIAAWLLLLALAVPFALQLEGALKTGGFSDPRGESVKAQRTLERAFDEAPNSLLVVLHSKDGSVEDAVAPAREAVRRDGVSAVTDRATHPEWLSKDGRTTFIQVGFTSDNTTVQNLVPDLQDDVRDAVGENVQVDVTGAPALDYALNVHSKEDVTRAEMIAFPVLFVVLLLVFRSVAAMVVPLLMAGVTLMFTQSIGYGMTQFTDVNSLFTNIVSMVGLAVAVDYSLFIVKRFREELAEGRAVDDALDRTMRTVGHSVLFSGLAVVVALSALFIPRAMSFTSIALGGVAVSLVAVAIAVTLLPAVLSLLGDRINWGTLRSRKKAGEQAGKGDAGKSAATDGRTGGSADGRADGRTDGRTGGRFSGRPGLVLAGLVVVFAALAAPAAQLTLRVPVASADILPSDDSARIGMERIKQDIGVREMFPVQVVLSADRDQADALLRSATDVASYAKTAPGADKVQAVTSLGLPAASLSEALADPSGLGADERAALGQLWTLDGDRLVTRVVVTPGADPDSSAAHHLVDDLRDHLGDHADSAVTVRLAGATATGSDFDDLVLRSVPLVVASVALLSFLILLFAFRSVLLPLLALAFNIAVVGASLGFLALVSGNDDHSINSVTPLMLFAVMFGLSMDYMVIMISRMRESYLGGLSHRESVLGGLARTAGLVNGAAAIMVAVFASFTSAQISIVRELGISLAVAVVLDALVIRRLVMPATLLLVGDRVWGRHRRTAPRALAPEQAVGPEQAAAPRPAAATDGEEADADEHLPVAEPTLR
ncbi:MMPL family transporter [Streptomyces sp. BH-SS-21]|uniref:MMPL family transporter n=1 Tax=Streptomyces liliiviolaceus TaxID=2823109 RepID=A0A940XPK7_9ACTN|nr:MMPL family transporter [Streptomyces liliiviolaceus]MBQ0848102.1 MMPL family transporter [Streptomyces liliiviolaceus]